MQTIPEGPLIIHPRQVAARRRVEALIRSRRRQLAQSRRPERDPEHVAAIIERLLARLKRKVER